MSFSIKKGDTNPSMVITVAGDLTGITFTEIRWRLATGVPLPKTVGTFANLTLLSATATKSLVQYDWVSPDTDIPGEFEGEIAGTIAGKPTSIPGGGRFRFFVDDVIA